MFRPNLKHSYIIANSLLKNIYSYMAICCITTYITLVMHIHNVAYLERPITNCCCFFVTANKSLDKLDKLN